MTRADEIKAELRGIEAAREAIRRAVRYGGWREELMVDDIEERLSDEARSRTIELRGLRRENGHGATDAG